MNVGVLGSGTHPAWRPGQAAFTCRVGSHRALVQRTLVQNHLGPLQQMQIAGPFSGFLSFVTLAPGLSTLCPMWQPYTG